jgi:hypothetical protein
MARGSFDVRREIFQRKKARNAKWRAGFQHLFNTFAKRLAPKSDLRVSKRALPTGSSVEPIPSRKRPSPNYRQQYRTLGGRSEVVGREGFEPSTYGLKVQATPALMVSKVKSLQRFFCARRTLPPEPNLCPTPFR